jgi:sugar lactone lactonase YvrE
MKSRQAWEVVLEHRCSLGEGPLWDAVKKRILWVDILEGEIHQFYPDRNEYKSFMLGSMVGSMALRSSEEIIAALKTGFTIINLETGTLRFIAHPETHLPENRFNDGKCDPAGRFWAGTMSMLNTPGAGSLYTLEADHSVVCKIKAVTCSNGLAWSNDCQTLYYIDTPTCEVVAYDYDCLTGNIDNKRSVIQIPRGEGYPDGMTIDTEGMLWVAMWDGWQVTRWNPRTGQLLKRIRLPVSNITSCTFGGDNLQDLYITSAKNGLHQDELKTQPFAGCLFVIKNSGYQGMPAFKFAG